MSQRFSDAELAAEYWQTAWETKCLQADGYDPTPALHEAETIYRFATLPHAHEEPKAYKFSCGSCEWETREDSFKQGEDKMYAHRAIDHPKPYRTTWEPL